jgi:hypothetical protein
MVKHVIPQLATDADLRSEFALLRSDLRNAVTELKVWMIATTLAVSAFADTILFVALRH